MDEFLFSFPILLVAILVARVINERAMKKLPDDKRLGLIDLFSKNRIVSIITLVVFVGLFFASLRLMWFDPWVTIGIFLGIFVIYLGLSIVYALRTLKKHDYPNAYISSYLLATAIRLGGLAVYFAILFLKIKNI